MDDHNVNIITPKQVGILQARQANEIVHPYTCVNRGDGRHDPTGEGLLVPTVRGLICPYCDYVQLHSLDFSPVPPSAVSVFLEELKSRPTSVLIIRERDSVEVYEVRSGDWETLLCIDLLDRYDKQHELKLYRAKAVLRIDVIDGLLRRHYGDYADVTLTRPSNGRIPTE